MFTAATCVDGGRAAAPSRHSNASVRGRHRLQPKRAAFVGELPSSQVETRSPNRSPAPKGSHGTRSSPESFSAARVALRRHHRQSSAPLGTCPALDGEPGDHGLHNSETDKATPDDDNDFVSLASYTYESVQPPSL